MWLRYDYQYTIDKTHGLGILKANREQGSKAQNTYHAFFEDDTYIPEFIENEAYGKDSAINYLLRFSDDSWRRYSKKDTDSMKSLLAQASCTFFPTSANTIGAEITSETQNFRLQINHNKRGYGYCSACSCGKTDCIHTKTASLFCQNRIAALQHAYVTTSQPVDKTLFLESVLESAVHDLGMQKPDEQPSELARSIIVLVDSANSEDYYRLFHEYMLDLSPLYEVYDSHFLEDYYPHFFMMLFEDKGYRKALLENGSYADAPDYEDRQHRSNRACFKRLLKEYEKTCRELDVQDNYSKNPFKETLLKYRMDLPGLMRYYAESKKDLSTSDMPYLLAVADKGMLVFKGSTPADSASQVPVPFSGLLSVARKLDDKSHERTADHVFHRLVDTLPADQKVEIYSHLRNFTMPLSDIKTLTEEDQRKMINNMPVTLESFEYTFDTLLVQNSDAEKGLYLLQMVDRARFSGDLPLKMAIARKASTLPDSRLLLIYVTDRMNLKNTWKAAKGTPENELSTYFRCEYDIVSEKSHFYTDFNVTDPVSGAVLFNFREFDGKTSPSSGLFSLESCSSDTVRKLCLKEKEEEYRKNLEKTKETVEAYLFAESHKKFISDYRQLVDSLKDEKYLFTETQKAGIDWLVSREDRSNALAFKVGHNKKYIVKDAMEFIGAFKRGQTTEYGKDLILTHNPENLNETDAAVIKLLMAAKYTGGRKSDKKNKRYITVSDSVLGSILELLTGRTIMYNDIPCKLRMDPQKIRLRIDSRYVLSSDLDANTQELLNLPGKSYLVTKQKDNSGAVMDLASGTAEEINLIDLADRNPDVSIKPILPDFKKNIYSRFFEIIDVDKTVERDFTLSQLRLNTYFDYEKSVVTARIAIFKNGKEIPETSLRERIDQVKFDLLRDYLHTLGFADGVLADESRILAFFKLDFTRLKSLTNVYLSENLQNKELKSIGRPVIRVTYSNNLLQVFLESSEYTEAELEQILAGLRKKKKYILLSGNRIIDLESEAAQDLGEAVSDFGMNPKHIFEKKRVDMVTAIKAFSHERSCRVDKYLRDMIEAIRTFKDADIPVPRLDAELRGYQVEGFKWMSILAGYNMGGILADDMGLGKTIQVIALIKADRTKKPSLVVCPKSLVFNWISEFARFDGETPVTAIYGTEARRGEKIAEIDYGKKGIYITSYDSLRNDIAKYTGEFNYGILDEAQYIKNVHALKTKSVKELKVKHRFALTGTPIENSVVDLWSIFDYIMPGYFEELSKFKDSDAGVIARKAGPFILRRVKEDVLEDLPPKYERILSADMSEEQRRLYEAMRQNARKQLEGGGMAFDLLPYLTRLRQVCVDPGMFVEDYTGGSGKLEMLASLIPEYLAAGHRMLIFSQFVKALESVRRLLEGLGISAYFLSGATPAKERVEMMDSFNNGSGTDVFLISLKAGGTGLNLTGADTVIHLDPWWNVAAENQASDRTHRIGQTRNVEVIRLIAADSVEQRVVELQEIKREVIRQVISDDDGSVTSARIEDIAFVLE